ncbi:MAG: succinate dehydrogenase assembly factor 2 [Pseudomonadota bacterium]|nr:hypothetical protein [Gammaproteobacteria bacterium]MEE2684404.1 succinate dehydrogenase assembly factor 2 [Pseudomonadota bacterium]
MLVDNISKLRWRCRRGMRELDSVLINFLDNFFVDLNQEEKEMFASLLELPDPDLHSFILGNKLSDNEVLVNLLKLIRSSIKSIN